MLNHEIIGIKKEKGSSTSCTVWFLFSTDLTLPLSIIHVKVIVYYELYYGNKMYLMTENVIQISPCILFKNIESLKIVRYSSQEK